MRSSEDSRLTNIVNIKINIYIVIISFLIVLSPHIRYIFGFYEYLLIVCIFGSYLIIEFFQRKGKLVQLMYMPLIMISLMIFYAAITTNPLETNTFYTAIISALCLLAADWLYRQDKILVKNVAFIGLLVFYVFFIFSGMTHGFTPFDINNYLNNSSRNVVSAIALFLQLFYMAAYYRVAEKIPLITPLLTLIIALLAFGRSGIALSILLVLFSYYIAYTKAKNYRILFILIFASIFLLIILNLQYIVEFIMAETNFARGFDSPRTVMNQGYLFQIDFSSLIIGADLTSVPIIQQYNGNPHNSYILGHSSFGILYLVYIGFFLFSSLFLFIVFQNTLVYFIFIIIFMIRIFSDMLSLMGVFDFIFYYFIFLLLEVYKLGSRRKIFRYKTYVLCDKSSNQGKR